MVMLVFLIGLGVAGGEGVAREGRLGLGLRWEVDAMGTGSVEKGPESRPGEAADAIVEAIDVVELLCVQTNISCCSPVVESCPLTRLLIPSRCFPLSAFTTSCTCRFIGRLPELGGGLTNTYVYLSRHTSHQITVTTESASYHSHRIPSSSSSFSRPSLLLPQPPPQLHQPHSPYSRPTYSSFSSASPAQSYLTKTPRHSHPPLAHAAGLRLKGWRVHHPRSWIGGMSCLCRG